MVTITQLMEKLEQVRHTYPNIPVKAEGWNDSGDLMDIALRGDVRLVRDKYGNPVLVIR